MTNYPPHTAPPLDPSVFERYHRSFKGDTYDACQKCGGKCEQYSICTLMPGEKEYLAAQLGMDLRDIEDGYLDGIDTPFGTVDVLKMKNNCPWLDEEFSCSIREIKPVLCDTYPIVCTVGKDGLACEIDEEGCPVMSRPEYTEVLSRFRDEGIRALHEISAPLQWWRIVEFYDTFDFDYIAIEKRLRTTPGYQSFYVEEILAFACLGGEAGARKTGLKLLDGRIRSTQKEALARLPLQKASSESSMVRLTGAFRLQIVKKGTAAKELVAKARKDPGTLIADNPDLYLNYVRQAFFLMRSMAELAETFSRRLDEFRTNEREAVGRRDGPLKSS